MALTHGVVIASLYEDFKEIYEGPRPKAFFLRASMNPIAWLHGSGLFIKDRPVYHGESYRYEHCKSARKMHPSDQQRRKTSQSFTCSSEPFSGLNMLVSQHGLYGTIYSYSDHSSHHLMKRRAERYVEPITRVIHL